MSYIYFCTIKPCKARVFFFFLRSWYFDSLHAGVTIHVFLSNRTTKVGLKS